MDQAERGAVLPDNLLPFLPPTRFGRRAEPPAPSWKGKIEAAGFALHIRDIAFHRNGVGGSAFHVVLFGWHQGHAPRDMMAVVHHQPGCCAVLDVNSTQADDIAAHGDNCFRGDQFEPALREAIARWSAAR